MAFAAFARRAAEAGSTVVVPCLFGTPGKAFSGPYAAAELARARVRQPRVRGARLEAIVAHHRVAPRALEGNARGDGGKGSEELEGRIVDFEAQGIRTDLVSRRIRDLHVRARAIYLTSRECLTAP